MLERVRSTDQLPWSTALDVVKNAGLALAAAFLVSVGSAAAQSPSLHQIRGPHQIHIAHEPIELDRKNPEIQKVGVLTYLGGLRLSSPDARFGGFSGLIVSPDGQRMIAVSDRGNLLEARLVYDSGRLAGVSDARICALNNRWGDPVKGLEADAEAIVRLRDGSLAVSFERDHRIVRYVLDQKADQSPDQGPDQGPNQSMLPCERVGPARLFYKMADWRAMRPNGGLEAMTLLDDGTLFALSEDARTADGLIKGWLILNRESRPVFYQPTGKFLPTDMVYLTTGDLLVLERRFSLLAGVASRLCLVEGSTIQPGATLNCNTAARIVSPFTTENYEGLAVRAMADGTTVVYMLSDDNFNALQSTILMMFRLELDELD